MALPNPETLTFNRIIAAPRTKVFAAIASVEARKDWTRPNAAINIIYEQEDFRPGRGRCQPVRSEGRGDRAGRSAL